jgi:anti-sigma B factor antagonist
VTDGSVRLELLHFPVASFERSQQHAAAVQRELDVLRVDERRASRMPRSLDEVVADLDRRYSGYRSTMDVLAALVEEGTDHADVVIPVAGDPEERAAAIEELRDLLDEVDAYCEAGDQLLTVATPPDLRRFRAWLFDEVIGQLRGAPPTPWVDEAPPRPDPPASTTSEDSATTPPVVVREEGTLDLASAARVRHAIQDAFTADGADVVVDLTDVDFVDSVILSVFVTAHKRFRDTDRRISFVVPERLLRVFELTGLVGVLDVRQV